MNDLTITISFSSESAHYTGEGYVAVTDAYDGAPDSNSPMCRGATEREAVNGLLDQIELQQVADAARRIA